MTTLESVGSGSGAGTHATPTESAPGRPTARAWLDPWAEGLLQAAPSLEEEGAAVRQYRAALSAGQLRPGQLLLSQVLTALAAQDRLPRRPVGGGAAFLQIASMGDTVVPVLPRGGGGVQESKAAPEDEEGAAGDLSLQGEVAGRTAARRHSADQSSATHARAAARGNGDAGTVHPPDTEARQGGGAERVPGTPAAAAAAAAAPARHTLRVRPWLQGTGLVGVDIVGGRGGTQKLGLRHKANGRVKGALRVEERPSRDAGVRAFVAAWRALDSKDMPPAVAAVVREHCQGVASVDAAVDAVTGALAAKVPSLNWVVD